jgi:hypothetical protein
MSNYVHLIFLRWKRKEMNTSSSIIWQRQMYCHKTSHAVLSEIIFPFILLNINQIGRCRF